MKIIVLLIILFSGISIYSQVKNPERLDKRWKTDTTNRITDLNTFTALMPRDGFPVIHNPELLGRTAGLKTYFSREPVLSIVIDGIAKAYPLNILTFHEIANDVISGIPIAVTYCPLCNSGLVYDRRLSIGDVIKTASFAVSGMLRKSDMVMWDDITETWWQQLTGEGLVGELAGSLLKVIPSQIISVDEFFKNYPDGMIMSNSTNVERLKNAYGKNPYISYDSIGNKPYRFFDTLVDSRLPAMERVISIESNGEFKIYPMSTVSGKNVINDTFKEMSVVIFFKPGSVSILDKNDIRQSRDIGMVTVFNPVIDGEKFTFTQSGTKFIDSKTKSVWSITGKCISGRLEGKSLDKINNGIHFAFAWLAFHPDSEIFGK